MEGCLIVKGKRKTGIAGENGQIQESAGVTNDSELGPRNKSPHLDSESFSGVESRIRISDDVAVHCGVVSD